MSNETGGPAFPTLKVVADMALSDGGITVRDYFAAQSISGINPGRIYGDDGVQWIADMAYKLADAMLRARKAP